MRPEDESQMTEYTRSHLPNRGIPRTELRELKEREIEATPSPLPGAVGDTLHRTLENHLLSSSTESSEITPSLDPDIYPPPEMPTKQVEAEELAARLKTTVEELPAVLMQLKEDMEQRVREVQRFSEQFKTKPKNRAMRRAQKFGHSRLYG